MKGWKQFIVSSAIGNVLEYYCFILYGFFSAIIAQQFFPVSNPFNVLALTFAVFASGCLMRPFGSLLFGFIGDKFGRKCALVLSVGLMALTTASIGLLPGYATIGLLAPVLLTTCRLLQGMVMSVEEMHAAIFLMENAPAARQGLAASIILGSVYFGLLISAIIALLTTSFLTHAALIAWGWRIPFLLALPLGLLAVTLRLRQPESRAFVEAANAHSQPVNPISEVIKKHKLNLVTISFLAALLAAIAYFLAVYCPGYLIAQQGIQAHQAMFINMVSFLSATILTILVGHMADKWGHAQLIKMACLLPALLAYPILFLLTSHHLLAILGAELLLSLCLSLTAGTLMLLLINCFPVPLRCTGLGLGFNISMTVFGSTTPLIALYLTKFFHHPTAPALYLIVAAGITGIGIKLLNIKTESHLYSTHFKLREFNNRSQAGQSF